MNVTVIGLGYAGLPLTVKLCLLGHNVTGVDKDKKKIDKFQNNVLPFAQDEPYLMELFKKAILSKRMSFSLKFDSVSTSDLVFINVDTPLKGNKPDNSSLFSATQNCSKFLKKGTIVVIESTVAPKTCDNLLIPILEKDSNLKINKDFFLAHVPERIRPNHIFKQLTKLNRVIGVSSIKIKPILTKIYSGITTGDLDFTSLAAAEVAKTVENTYRDVNIAFANEVAMACEELGVDIWQIRRLINKIPVYNLHEPGAGVGGHCIPKDPWLLASSVIKQSLKITRTARAINDSMPKHVLELAEKSLAIIGRKIKNTNLVILGYSYIGNSDDSRNSPTKDLVKRLKMKKAIFKIHDPYVSPYDQTNLERVITGADCLILMVAHDYYKKLKLKDIASKMNIKIIVDGRNFFDKKQAQKNGFIYKGVGNV